MVIRRLHPACYQQPDVPVCVCLQSLSTRAGVLRRRWSRTDRARVSSVRNLCCDPGPCSGQCCRPSTSCVVNVDARLVDNVICRSSDAIGCLGIQSVLRCAQSRLFRTGQLRCAVLDVAPFPVRVVKALDPCVRRNSGNEPSLRDRCARGRISHLPDGCGLQGVLRTQVRPWHSTWGLGPCSYSYPETEGIQQHRRRSCCRPADTL